MLTGSLDKNFSFSQNEFDHISSESDTLKKDTEPLTMNSVDVNYKINSDTRNITESHSEDSVVCNSHDTFGKVTDDQIQPVSSSMFSDSSSAEFEIVSVNVKNTTVINATYNLISQSIIRNAEKKEFMSNSIQNLRKSPHKLSSSADKSRVVVQVLTSNAENCDESQTIAEDKNTATQSSSICSFRDDVFKMLSKSKLSCDSKYQLGKSQMAIENKGDCSPNSNIYSFSNDVFNMLSKVKPDSCDDKNGDNTEDMQTADAAKNENAIEINSKYNSSNHIVRSRRKRNLNFFFLNGTGTKLCEIESVASNLKNASSRLLRILHYVLFDIYGPCNSGIQISKTKKSILLFCGYPFKKDSESYLKKKNCLQRLPFPILCEMYQAVIGNGCSNRSEMVTQLVNFFLKPKAHYSVGDEAEIFEQEKSQEGVSRRHYMNLETISLRAHYYAEDEAETFKQENSREGLSKKDYTNLKAIALREPLPIVEVKKLTEEDIKKFQNQTKLDSGVESNETDSSGEVSSYFLPAYILKGPGMKLKSFPKILKKICRAKSRMIEILHYILYGRLESTKTCLRNILEFSGFLPCQKEFISEREDLLNSMDHFELFQLCNILCLRGKTNTRTVRIKKILAYLSKPSEPRKYRSFQKNIDKGPCAVTPKLKYRKPCFQKSVGQRPYTVTPNLKYRKPCSQRNIDKGLPAVTPKLKYGKPTFQRNVENVATSKLEYEKPCSALKAKNINVPELRDFKNICSNIECASPSDLTELNDLLFIKPCDESEIHQKILDFSPFDFSLNSMEYHYRKTLLHYMSFCVIKRIAQLLDIEEWEKCNSQADLSSSILTFLMEMKSPDSVPCKVPPAIIPLEDTLSRKEKSSKSKSQTLQVYEKKTEESWSFKSGPKTKQNQESSSDHRHSNGRSIVSAHKNQAVSKKSVFIHRLTKASALKGEISQNTIDCQQNIMPENDDDATPLRALLHHPSDLELQQMITNIIKSDLWSSTIGELVQKVYQCYPQFNLSYREDFIKKEARQIISQLRSNAVDTINSMQCKLSDVI